MTGSFAEDSLLVRNRDGYVRARLRASHQQRAAMRVGNRFAALAVIDSAAGEVNSYGYAEDAGDF